MRNTPARPRAGRTRSRFRALALALVPALVAVLALAGCGSQDRLESGEPPSRYQGVELATPSSKPSFTLTDTAGRPYDFAAETADRLTLLYFGYTHCPDICPVHLANIAEVLQRGDIPKPVVVFVTVDPARDTPAVMRSWLDKFSPDFVGLTGTPEQIAAAEEAAGAPPSVTEPAGANGDYGVGHTSQVFAYAPDGKGYTVYPFGTRQSDWAHDLPLLAALTPGAPAAKASS
jgi:protein SCO1/2